MWRYLLSFHHLFLNSKGKENISLTEFYRENVARFGCRVDREVVSPMKAIHQKIPRHNHIVSVNQIPVSRQRKVVRGKINPEGIEEKLGVLVAQKNGQVFNLRQIFGPD